MVSVLSRIREELYKVSEIDSGEEGDNTNTSAILDFLKNISCFRESKEEEIIDEYRRVFYSDSASSLKLLFFIRDKVNGLGEKRIFRVLIKYLANEHPKYIASNLELIPKYGRWDDLYFLFDTQLEDKVIDLFKKQIQIDINSKRPSTLGKWLKSENTSSRESINLGKKTRRLLGYSQKEYRKLLSNLRGKIGIVERSLSSKDYTSINYESLTKMNLIKYKRAFIRKDKNNFEKYLRENIRNNFIFKNPENLVSDIIKYLENLNINSIEDMYSKNWEYIIDTFEYYEKNIEDTLVINGLDTDIMKKDSNYFNILITTILLYSKLNFNSFKNYYISFKKNPKFNKTTGLNILDDIKMILNNNINYNIDLFLALDLLLFTIIKKNLENEEIPKSILFIYNNTTEISLKDLESFNEKWLSLGLNIPKIKLWNLDDNFEKFEIENTNKVTVIKGYDKRMWSYILAGKEIKDYDIIIDNFNNTKYNDLIV